MRAGWTFGFFARIEVLCDFERLAQCIENADPGLGVLVEEQKSPVRRGCWPYWL